jgi:hypothetical protein
MADATNECHPIFFTARLAIDSEFSWSRVQGEGALQNHKSDLMADTWTLHLAQFQVGEPNLSTLDCCWKIAVLSTAWHE